MQIVLASFNKALRQSIVVIGLMFFINFSGLFFFVQPSYAVGFSTEKPAFSTEKLTPEEKIDRAYEYNRAAGIRAEDRQEAYEQAVKDSESPQSVEKVYERNVKAYEKENQEPNLIEKAEDLIEKVTGK
ncbi:hypothetical protein [Mastigocladopsis repens]|uniref:hypothetical protein n=1 Tax=Mastigocladopsis repens TaxID=221287 RepID=UPI0002D91842|nr:hypothetical protein [Mastigocladopsis repens]